MRTTRWWTYTVVLSGLVLLAACTQPQATPIPTPTQEKHAGVETAPTPTVILLPTLTQEKPVEARTVPAPTGILPPPPQAGVTIQAMSPGIEITAIEVTQGIQNLGNDMPLVEQRRTDVRVYIRAFQTAGPLPFVAARLCGIRDGALVGDCIDPETQPITALVDGGDRLNLDDSFYFYLPPDWRWGTVTLQAAVARLGPGFDLKSVTVTFNPANPLNVTLVPAHLHLEPISSSPLEIYYASEIGTPQIYLGMYRLHPIATLNIEAQTLFPPVAVPFVLPPPNYGLGPDGLGDEWDWEFHDDRHNLLDTLADYAANTDGWASDLLYYAMIDPVHDR